jgi:hypothetical protein
MFWDFMQRTLVVLAMIVNRDEQGRKCCCSIVLSGLILMPNSWTVTLLILSRSLPARSARMGSAARAFFKVRY